MGEPGQDSQTSKNLETSETSQVTGKVPGANCQILPHTLQEQPKSSMVKSNSFLASPEAPLCPSAVGEGFDDLQQLLTTFDNESLMANTLDPVNLMLQNDPPSMNFQSLAEEPLSDFSSNPQSQAFHSPCTLNNVIPKRQFCFDRGFSFRSSLGGPEMFILYCSYPFIVPGTLWRLGAEDVAFLERKGCLHLPQKHVLDQFFGFFLNHKFS